MAGAQPSTQRARGMPVFPCFSGLNAMRKDAASTQPAGAWSRKQGWPSCARRSVGGRESVADLDARLIRRHASAGHRLERTVEGVLRDSVIAAADVVVPISVRVPD